MDRREFDESDVLPEIANAQKPDLRFEALMTVMKGIR